MKIEDTKDLFIQKLTEETEQLRAGLKKECAKCKSREPQLFDEVPTALIVGCNDHDARPEIVSLREKVNASKRTFPEVKTEKVAAPEKFERDKEFETE